MTRLNALRFAWIATLTFALTAEATLAETYVVDASHSSVDFSIRHLVGRTKGRFGDFSGTISYDAAKPAASSFSGTIQVKSIDTGNERRDGHLQSDDFFGAATYPTITFESTEVTSAGENTLSVKGKLTMHGTTKEVTLLVEILGTGTNPRSGKAQIGLETNFSILCSDYGVNSWERFSAVLGDEVKIQVLIEANAE
jgi:polyisoprenoid-binding protein YceI